MKSLLFTISLLLTLVLGTSNSQAILSADATRLRKEFEQDLKKLEQSLKRSIRVPAQGAVTDYRNARAAELAADKALKEAQARVGMYNAAQGLVAHAKGKWIKDAERGIAAAKAKIKSASNDAQREAAEKELANWEKNREAGMKALEERQAKLKEAERDLPAAKKALDDASKQLAEAKQKSLAAIGAMGVDDMLGSDQLDASLARYVVLSKATPDGLAEFAGQSREKQEFLEAVLSDSGLLIQILVADGPRNNNYARALDIYHQIQQASEKAAEGPLQRLALAIALEHAEPRPQRNAVSATDAPRTVDPLKRYLQFEAAYLGGELDPAFSQLTAWDLRMVVDGEEPDEISIWGRKMLRNHRPDHITMNNYHWRYLALVRSDIPYGSDDVKYDRDDLQLFQNILMNGGVCGRRAFIGRFILRSFGIPTTARPQKGHAALAHWTPEGWVVCLGAGWGRGWTKGPYGDDLNFLASTQARATGAHYLRVQRAYWIGALMGEKHCYGLVGHEKPGFWNGIALNTQRALIDAAKSKTLPPVGEELAEATGSEETNQLQQIEISEKDRKIQVDRDDVITIPAAATREPQSNGGGIIFLPSVLGGKQLHFGGGARSPAEYVINAPEKGRYALVAHVVTPSWKQGLDLFINNEDQPIAIPLPHTVGLWQSTEPVAVELNRGRNTLRFHRTDEHKSKGFSIHQFKLVPWDLHEKSPASFDPPSQSENQGKGISTELREALSLSLLKALVGISEEGGLKPLPMDLTVTHSKVSLVRAKGSGILTFQASSGEQTADIALEDLKLEDHALLARLMAELRPKDPLAQALAGMYMEALENSKVASSYLNRAGPKAVEELKLILGMEP